MIKGAILRRAGGMALVVAATLLAPPASADDCWSGRYQVSVDAAADTRPDEVAIEVDECAVALEWDATDRVGFPLRDGFPLSGTAEKSAHLRLVHATGVVREMAGELRLDDEESDTPWITVVFPERLDATSILRIYVSKTMPMFCANPVYVKSCAQFRDAPASPP